MKRPRPLAVALVAFAVAALALGTAWFFLRRDPAPSAPPARFPSLAVVSCTTALVEKPDAVRVWLADDASASWEGPLSRAGLSCARDAAGGPFDLVVVSGPQAPGAWKSLLARLAPGGALAWNLDVRGMTAAAFRRALEAFPCRQAHVWMPCESDWLLTGSPEPRRVELDAALDVFAREAFFEDLADAGCETLASLFASYAGAREDLLPAFGGGDLEALVRPEFFLTEEPLVADWLEQGVVEDDIYEAIGREILEVQRVRRLVVEGAMLSRNEAGAAAAEDKWVAAAARNPRDPMLLERRYRLALNARVFMKVGNFKGAARCLETLIVLCPDDAAAVLQYADCLKLLGRSELAAEVRARAADLLRRADERVEKEMEKEVR